MCRRVLMFHHIQDGPEGEEGYEGLTRSTEFTYANEKEAQHPSSPIDPLRFPRLNLPTKKQAFRRNFESFAVTVWSICPSALTAQSTSGLT